MIRPELAEFQTRWDGRSRVQLAKDIPADLETPVTAFLKLRTHGATFLLETVEGDESLARYSFLGLAPFLTWRCEEGKVSLKHDHEHEEAVLDEEGPLPHFSRLFAEHPIRPLTTPGVAGGAFVGYLSYDFVRFWERLPFTAQEVLHLPEAVLLFPETVLAFDHLQHRITVTTLAGIKQDSESEYRKAAKRLAEVEEALLRGLPSDVNAGVEKVKAEPLFAPTREIFLSAVEQARSRIAAGELSQVVLSQRQEGKTRAHPFQVYRALRMQDPSPYMFYLDFDDFQMIGSSPSSLVSLEGRRAVVRPTAGSRPRGEGAEDKLLEQDLLTDPKARVKHGMLVDLAKSELAGVCDEVSVEAGGPRTVERTTHEMHLCSRVSGQLKEGKNLFDLLRAVFPAGTVTGFPKRAAMEAIEALEPTRRSFYGGCIGHFSVRGGMSLTLAIRTILLRGENYLLQAGGRVLRDIDPEQVYGTVQSRLKALHKAIESAETGF